MRNLIAILLLSYSHFVDSSELVKNTDIDLAYILGTQEVLHESKGFHFVQVIQTWETISECGGTYQSCPNARLFILVSTGDLYEPPRLYELPKSKGWKVVDSWETENERYILLQTTLRHANVSVESRATWVSKKYKIAIPKYDAGARLVK